MRDSCVWVMGVVVVGVIVSVMGEEEADVRKKYVNKGNDNEVPFFYPVTHTSNLSYYDSLVNEKVMEIMNQCTMMLIGLFKYCDVHDYNCDWLLYVSDPAAVYWKIDKNLEILDKALMSGKLPMGIEPLPTEHRKSAIYTICQWMSETHALHSLKLDQYALRPYTIKGFLHVTNLHYILKPYNTMPAEYFGMINECADHLEGLIKYYKRHLIDYSELVRNIIGVNPYFSLVKWCTLGINHIERRLFLTRQLFLDNIKRNQTDDEFKRPLYDFGILPVVEPNRFDEMLKVDDISDLAALLDNINFNLSP